jgi:2-methylcitrate dehydratase PrpD
LPARLSRCVDDRCARRARRHPLTKGHAGAAILPALLAVIDGAQAASRPPHRRSRASHVLVLGYEIATRAGIALHATVSDYHCSGAWNALGCAAIAARLLALDTPRIARRSASPNISVRAARSCACATRPRW